jgi:hypothetical protein
VSIRLLAAGAALLVIILMMVTMRNIGSRPAEIVETEQTEPDWKVTRANSAHGAFVVEVEAEHVDRAREIASEIVDPVRSKGYEEILIYIRPLGQPDGPTRRIQWTPAGGFVESSY